MPRAFRLCKTFGFTHPSAHLSTHTSHTAHPVSTHGNTLIIFFIRLWRLCPTVARVRLGNFTVQGVPKHSLQSNPGRCACTRCKADGDAGSAVPGAALSAGVGVAWADEDGA
jgi:hypothetical protein